MIKSFSLDQLKLHYRVFGTGNPVIFLHGFLEDHTIWNPIAEELAESGCELYLIDLPCHGLSRFEGEICTMAAMAELVHEFCASEKLNHPHVIGHSMGGYVGLELLKRRKIELTLLHSNFWEDPDEKKKDRDRVVKIVQENKMRLILEAIPNLFAPANRERCEHAIQHLILEASKIPATEICAATRGMRDRLDQVEIVNKHQISMIHGEFDPIIPTKELENQLTRVNLKPDIHTIRDCGHMSLSENPSELIKLIRKIVFS